MLQNLNDLYHILPLSPRQVIFSRTARSMTAMNPAFGPHRRYSREGEIYSKAEVYYSSRAASARKDVKNRTFSSRVESGNQPVIDRRYSLDERGQHRKFLIPVESTLKALLDQEDTDKNSQITVDDTGPKVITVGTNASEGYRQAEIRGNYQLSNLLQELTLAQDQGRQQIVLDEARLNEDPVDRLHRYIRDLFWDNLTRRIDGSNIEMVAKDPKDWTADPRPRVYVPHGAPEQYEYYSRIAEKHPQIRLDVQWLPKEITPEYIRDLNAAPGLLAVAMDQHTNAEGEKTLRGKPFIVPGGRFNEFYGWDSYMASLGLLVHDRVEICKSMVEQFCFCIEHYGKILNANRTYYLGRSQPPFLTDMTLRVYERIKHEDGAMDFLRLGIFAAIKDYYGLWTAKPRIDEKTGLSRYRPVGVGVPPETESSHFQHVLEPYVKKHNMTFKEFVEAYNHKRIDEPELDIYFLHDRAVRESGHDTSYRLENLAADVATVDLNSCLYKYESDIARVIRTCFNDRLVVPPEFHVEGMPVDGVQKSAAWDRRAKKRRLAMDKYCWNEEKGMFFDYNTVKQKRSSYESVTTFWAMWSGVATPRQAAAMVIKALPKFECFGGLSSGTEESRGEVGLHRPNRQWDYPYGWAPHQLLAWAGFQRYGYTEEAQRLAYRWLYMMTKAFVDFNGVVVEKYNVTVRDRPQYAPAEYGNQGVDFKCVPREGFAWVNASYVVGLNMMDAHMKRALGTLTPWETFEKATQDLDVYSHDLGHHELDSRKSGFLEQGHSGSAHFQQSHSEQSLDPPRSKPHHK